MDSRDRLEREVDSLSQRLNRLSAAVLRVSASLDEPTVLQEIVDSACALTEARHGVITTLGADGRVRNFVTSGLTGEQRRKLDEWLPDGLLLFRHLRDLAAPLRLADLPAYARSLGYSDDPIVAKTFLGTPMRCRDAHVGSFFLAGKADGNEFSAEDEEALVLFASQAAAAIANARTHRAEQRARANLETLVDTSPVGVVVFDAAAGEPITFNREARRLVRGLGEPGGSPQELLEILVCRFADGREVSLGEYPMSRVIRDAATVRAEEVELSVADGPGVRALINATTIRDAEGEAESMVVTMQDLEPLEEMERLRARLFGTVSHELGVPLAAIKGSAATVLGAPEDVDRAEMLQFFRIVEDQADQMRNLIGDLLDAGRIETGTLSIAPEAHDVAALVERARSAFVGAGARHAVRVDTPRDLPRVLVDGQRIVQVLNNLLSNAAAHSPESSEVRIQASAAEHHVEVSVDDDGRGIAPEALPHLFRTHGGMAEDDRGAAAGLGLAICKGLVEAHGGRIRAVSGGPGRGTRIAFTIPAVDEPAGMPYSGADAARRSPLAGEAHERPRVLVLDDDPETLRMVRHALAGGGYAPIVTGVPEEFAHLLRTARPDLVLLDLVLPGADGIELLERLPELAHIPVIFISAYGGDESIAKALETGAEDYIVKPFSATELTARVRVALRKRLGPGSFALGDLSIDHGTREVTVAGRPVPLTATEYEVLRVLSANAGRVTTYEALLQRVWGGRAHAGPSLVRAFVLKLRRKLGDDSDSPAYIVNERSVGYRMRAPGDPRAAS